MYIANSIHNAAVIRILVTKSWIWIILSLFSKGTWGPISWCVEAPKHDCAVNIITTARFTDVWTFYIVFTSLDLLWHTSQNNCYLFLSLSDAVGTNWIMATLPLIQLFIVLMLCTMLSWTLVLVPFICSLLRPCTVCWSQHLVATGSLLHSLPHMVSTSSFLLLPPFCCCPFSRPLFFHHHLFFYKACITYKPPFVFAVCPCIIPFLSPWRVPLVKFFKTLTHIIKTYTSPIVMKCLFLEIFSSLSHGFPYSQVALSLPMVFSLSGPNLYVPLTPGG